MDPEWYRKFFHGVALDLWRSAVTEEQTRAEVDFLAQALDAAPGGWVLDVPCGNGRHAIELAGRGYRVSGVDLSDGFLEEARRRSSAAGLEVDWHLAEMRELPWTEELDGAYCFGNSFGYLDHDGTVEFLSAVSRSLRAGGRFILETGLAAESVLPTLADREWRRFGEITMLVHNRYHPAEGRLETEYGFVRDGIVDTRSSSAAVYTVAELGRLLARAGLVVTERWSSLEREPYEVGDERLILVAQRS